MRFRETDRHFIAEGTREERWTLAQTIYRALPSASRSIEPDELEDLFNREGVWRPQTQFKVAFCPDDVKYYPNVPGEFWMKIGRNDWEAVKREYERTHRKEE